MSEIEIPISKEDVEQGKVASVYCCPVALAIRRHYPYACVQVRSGYVTITSEGNDTVYKLGVGEHEKIINYDLGDPFSLQSVHLTKVEE